MSSWRKLSYNDILIQKRKQQEIKYKVKYEDKVLSEVLLIKNKLDPNNITIILQGIFCKEINIIDTISEYINYGKIILTIYEKLCDINILTTIINKFPSVIIIYSTN